MYPKAFALPEWCMVVFDELFYKYRCNSLYMLTYSNGGRIPSVVSIQGATIATVISKKVRSLTAQCSTNGASSLKENNSASQLLGESVRQA